jgi:hydroxysqualene dehydroxylase
LRHVHVVGAGLAGLAAALSLADAGRRVLLYEAGPAAGGRCRSYFDRELGCRIDNGNHLLLSGNTAAYAYLDQIGTSASLGGPGAPIFPFFDLGTGERWTLRPNAGRIPWWLLFPRRRVPGTALRHYFPPVLALRYAGPETSVAAVLPDGAVSRRLLTPLAIAALNTRPEAGSARLLHQVLRETLLRGGRACIPAFPREGLSESFVIPALSRLAVQRAEIQYGRRVAALLLEAGRVAALGTPDGPIELERDDQVVLAVPAPVAAGLLPALRTPNRFEAIINLHYRAEVPPGATPGGAGFVGLVGGTAEWVFVKPSVVSVTISAANGLMDEPNDVLAATVWGEVCRALCLDVPLPPWRVVREKRATFAATPEQEKLRPPARASIANLVLAGDWTDTGLPATIEGAIRSGRTAAKLLLSA